jgi:hypothetical protein
VQIRYATGKGGNSRECLEQASNSLCHDAKKVLVRIQSAETIAVGSDVLGEGPWTV